MLNDCSNTQQQHTIKRLKLSLALLSISCLSSSYVQANDANLYQLTEDKVRHYLELKQDDDLSFAIAQQRQQLALLATTKPQEQRHAKVLFKRGLSSKALNDLLNGDNNAMTVTHVEGKVALPRSKTTLTVWFRDVQAHGANVQEALKHFEVLHGKEATARKNADKRKMTDGERDVTNDIFTSRKKLRYVEAEVTGSNLALSALLNETQDIELVVAGDVVTYHATAVDDLSNDVAPALDQSIEIDNFDGEEDVPDAQAATTALCGPLAAKSERNCPPDKYWVPSPKLISGASNSVLSYIINYSYQYDGASESLGLQSRDWSSGSFYSRFKWSTNPVNTAAYKDNSLAACVPSIDPFTTCQNQNNVIYIPASTYEDEGQVPNPACSSFSRTGTAWDRSFGCYVADYAWTNLPSGYLDTTLFDGQKYVATVGTFNASTVIPGRTYVHYQRFWAWGKNTLDKAKEEHWLNHSGQIGTRYCSYSPALCTFSVDSTIVHRNLVYRPISR